MTFLLTLCDRIAALFGYLPAARLERARQSRAMALRQAAHERQRRFAALGRAQELEAAMHALEAEVADLRRTADRVRA